MIHYELLNKFENMLHGTDWRDYFKWSQRTEMLWDAEPLE